MARSNTDWEGKRTYEIDELGDRKLPSVTTIQRLLDKPAITAWKVRLTAEYLKAKIADIQSGALDIFEMDADTLMAEARAYHKSVSQEALDIGSGIHDMIDRYFKGEIQSVDCSPLRPELRQAWAAFGQWVKENDVKCIRHEHTVWSEAAGGFAGTLDFFGTVKGRYFIVDFKSAKGIYPEQISQVGAYYFAFKEREPLFKVKLHAAIVRLDKESGEPSFYEIPMKELRPALAEFLDLARIWNRRERERAKKKAKKIH